MTNQFSQEFYDFLSPTDSIYEIIKNLHINIFH
jgi:hypothetical protein